MVKAEHPKSKRIVTFARMWCLFLSFLALSTITTVNGQSVVYLVRHAEKATTGDDPSLSEAGLKRAQKLAVMLKHAHVAGIYVSDKKRSRETAEPLAAQESIQITTIAHGDVDKTIDDCAAHHLNKPVVIVAHTDTIPLFLKHWDASASIQIDDDDYANIFVIVPGSPASWTRYTYRPD